jgi:competence protein ComEC
VRLGARWLAVPLAPLALAFALGIALAPRCPPRAAWWTWAGSLAAAFLLALGPRRRWAVIPLLAGTAALGALRATSPPLPADHIAHLPMPATARVEGTLVAEPIRWAPDRARLLVDVERADDLPRSGRLQAAIYGELPDLAEGQRISAVLTLREASGFRNPGVFDYAEYLAREGIGALATGRADRVAPLEPPDPPWPVRVKRRALEIMRGALPPTSAALLSGLLLGDRSGLPRDLDDAFRRAGVYHVLAVSGFNVALLAASVFALLVMARASRHAAAVGSMATVIAFACVVGPEPSVLRATIMAVLILGALVLEREASVLNSLALAALAILTARPGDLRDPGFQLSFVATAGLILAPLPRNRVLAAFGVSAAAQLAVLPVTLTHFNQVSTIGAITNLAAVPLAGIATVLGLAGVALTAALEPARHLFPAIAVEAPGHALLNAVWPVLLALRGAVRVAASVPGAVVHMPAPHWTAVVAYAAALALALSAWRLRAGAGGHRDLTANRDAPVDAENPRAPASSRPSRVMRRPGRVVAGAAVALGLTALAIQAWPIIRPPDGRLRVTVLDVGQGDAVVLEAPDGRTALLDAGPGGPHRLDTGERVVAPFLWNRGHLSLAVALATHADVDHAGGLPAIRRLFRLPEPGTPQALDAWARRSGLGLAVLEAPRRAAEGPPTRNDAALALRLELGLVSFLLASDITARTEGDLLRGRAPLAATVLKVAHHGARGSSTAAFVAAVNPAIAVISVGARNAYGHPSPQTLARLRAAGATIYRTDRDGAVSLETDGRALTVATWATRRRDRYCLAPDAIC